MSRALVGEKGSCQDRRQCTLTLLRPENVEHAHCSLTISLMNRGYR